jgi:hypothetical protein
MTHQCNTVAKWENGWVFSVLVWPGVWRQGGGSGHWLEWDWCKIGAHASDRSAGTWLNGWQLVMITIGDGFCEVRELS